MEPSTGFSFNRILKSWLYTHTPCVVQPAPNVSYFVVLFWYAVLWIIMNWWVRNIRLMTRIWVGCKNKKKLWILFLFIHKMNYHCALKRNCQIRLWCGTSKNRRLYRTVWEVGSRGEISVKYHQPSSQPAPRLRCSSRHLYLERTLDWSPFDSIVTAFNTCTTVRASDHLD